MYKNSCGIWLCDWISVSLNPPKSLEPLGTFSTNPIHQNDGYGQRHIWRPREPCVTWATKNWWLITERTSQWWVTSHESRIWRKRWCNRRVRFGMYFHAMLRHNPPYIARYSRRLIPRFAWKYKSQVGQRLNQCFPSFLLLYHETSLSACKK